MKKKKWKIEEFINAVIAHTPKYISSQELANIVGCSLLVAQNKIPDLRAKGYLKLKPTSKRKDLRREYNLAPNHKLYEIILRIRYKRGRVARGHPRDLVVRQTLKKALSTYPRETITMSEMIRISGFSRSYVGSATKPLIEEGILSKVFGGSARGPAVYKILKRATPVQEPLLTTPSHTFTRELPSTIEKAPVPRLPDMSAAETGYAVIEHCNALQKIIAGLNERIKLSKVVFRDQKERIGNMTETLKAMDEIIEGLRADLAARRQRNGISDKTIADLKVTIDEQRKKIKMLEHPNSKFSFKKPGGGG